MGQDILKILEDKGIQVPEHHVEMLEAQWEAFRQLKMRSNLEGLADSNIGLLHVPGGDRT